MVRYLHVSDKTNSQTSAFDHLRPAKRTITSSTAKQGLRKEFSKKVQRSYWNLPMPNILVVDHDEKFIEAFAGYFEASSYDFGLLPARNGREAVRMIEKGRVDLVVTELAMPEMDGFELLTFLNDHFPFIPVIVVSGSKDPETKEKLNALGISFCMDKPVEFKALEESILNSLEAEEGKGSITGVSVVSFIQLVDSDQKTCLLEARAQGTKPGYLYFNKGELWDAMWGRLTGREAAIEIIGWEEAEIYFKSLPKKKIKRRIESGLMSLIMAAMKHQDEKSRTREKAAVTIQEFPYVIDKKQESLMTPEAPEMSFSFETAEEEHVVKEEPAEAFPEKGSAIAETPGPLSLALGELLEIAGVEAVMVIEKDGSLVECSATPGAMDMSKLGVSVAMVLQGAEKMGSELQISAFQHVMLETEGKVIVCAPLGDAFLVLLAHDAQKLGMIRMRIKKKIPDMEIDFKI